MLHFLLRSEAVTISLVDLAEMTDAQVLRTFRQMRWPDTDGEPICPFCNHDHIYELKGARRGFKCAACRKQFTETSGTILHSRKLPLRTILMAILLWVNGVQGAAALRLRRDLGVTHKSAFVLLHKLREAIDDARSELQLGGVVEIDAAYYGGHVRPPNTGREGKRPVVKRHKQCLLTMVERGGNTINLVVAGETTEAVLEAAAKHVLPGTTIVADEHGAYDALHARYKVHRINHRWSYAEGDVSTNIAESSHSRMRRAEAGVYNRLSGKYLGRYGAEMAYRSDRRREANGIQFSEVGEMALAHPISREWKGRWQARPKAVREPERLIRVNDNIIEMPYSITRLPILEWPEFRMAG